MIHIPTFASIIVAACALCPPAQADDPIFFGYVEGDYAYIAPRLSGTIDQVLVADGQQIAADAPLFIMDSQRQRLSLEAAQAHLAVAEANWQDKSTGMRAEEIAIIEERLSSAEANYTLATITFNRTAELRKRQAVSASQFDQDQTAQLNAEAAVHQLKAELAAARLPARDAQIEAAHQSVLAAQAEVAQATLDLHDQTATAPVAGRVERVYLQGGEFAAVGTPVVSLLSPGNVKFRFYVPQSLHAQLRPETHVIVNCDGCGEPISAHITYIASQAQFTPPFIYSLEERDKLVFVVEARPEAMVNISVGQPIDVRLAP